MLYEVAVALAGMLVYLDTTAVAQFMICQPLIACPAWGVAVGRPEIGLFFGVVFQLLWLGSLPVGAAKFPEGNVGALVATALACGVRPGPDGAPAWIVIAIAALVGIITAHIGGEMTPLVRKILTGFSPRVVAAAEAGRRGAFTRLFVTAIGVHALAGLLLSIVTFLAGKELLILYLSDFPAAGVSPALKAVTDELLSALWPVLLGAGTAVIAARFVKRKSVVWFSVIAVAGSAAGWLCL